MRPVDRAGPVTGMKAGRILTARMALSELALPAVFYRHKNPINCSDTAFRVAEVMMGAKDKISVFCHVCLVSRIWCQISSPESLTVSHLGNWAEISHMNPKRNSSR